MNRQPIKFGKYLLLERIAVGGMAEVFVAKAFGVEGFERLLAIKKILPTLGEDSEFNTMFVDEARIAVQLSHANIVQVLDLGKHDDSLYIAMEYISGRDVRQLMERFRKRRQAMPVPQACTIVAKICEALDYAHRKRDTSGRSLGIVHRDVSPQNVLVSFEGDVKLIDFGIAKAESRAQRTQAGILKGKFSYMSPEQVRGQPIDHRSDVYAAGVLLWEMLCGEKLFTGDSDFAVLEKVRNGTVVSPRTLIPSIPEALEKVVLKALAAEVEDRYQWASELHDALVRFTLIGDFVYGSRQLAEWMHEEFHVEFEKEQARLRGWLGIEDPELEVTPSDPIRSQRRSASGINTGSPGGLALPLPLAAKTQPPLSAKLPRGRETTPGRIAPKRAPDSSTAHDEAVVQPPTPTGARHKTPPRMLATPAPGELRVPLLPEVAHLQTPPPADLSYDAPTRPMSMDDLAAAERHLALLAKERAAALPAAFGDGADERTLKDGAALAKELPVPVLGQTLPPPPPPQSKPPPQPQAAPQPSSTADVRRPLAMMEAFDVSDDPTAATREKRKQGLSRPSRGPLSASAPKQSSMGWLKVLVLLAAAGLVVWFVFPSDGMAPGKIAITVSPSVPADLLVDGKPSGTLPPFVRTLLSGPHTIEIRAGGYKPFTKDVTVLSGQRPLEVEATLLLEAPVATEPSVPESNQAPDGAAPEKEVVPREPSKVPWLRGSAATDAAPESKLDSKTAGPSSKDAGAPVPEPVHAPAPKQDAVEKPKESMGAKVADELVAPKLVAKVEPPASLEPGKSDRTRLRVITDPPGAQIQIADKLAGKSPAVIEDLDASMLHFINLTLDGYKPERRVVKFDDGPARELNVKLSPLAKTATSTPTPDPAPDAAPVAANIPKGAAHAGSLVIMSRPVARVRIDGADTGRWTPVPPSKPIALSPGAYTIELETQQGRRYEEKIVIEAGKTVRLIKMDL